MDYRVTDEKHQKIRNDISSIVDLEKISFYIMIDFLCDFTMSPYVNNDAKINLDSKDGKKETIILGLLKYLSKIFQSYCLLVSKSHKIACLVLQRTILEIIIKGEYLLEKDDVEVYDNYLLNSLVSEKFYMNTLDSLNFENISDGYVKRTIESINKTLSDTGIENLENISKKKFPFPSIEQMCNYLIEKGIASQASYDIAYRTTSNYTHANWSAVLKEKYHSSSEYCDWRMLVPITILILCFLFKSNEKLNKLDKHTVIRLSMYYESLFEIDKEAEKRYLEN